jgi:hypothetical protein
MAVDGNLLTPLPAIADLRAISGCNLIDEIWKVDWKAMAVEIDVHTGRSLTLRGFCLSAGYRAPFSSHRTLVVGDRWLNVRWGLFYTNSPTRVE